MEHLFDSFRQDPLGWLPEAFTSPGKLVPPLDIIESESEVTLRVELPGIDPKDLDLSVTGNTLTISGEKKETADKTEGGTQHVETRYGSFTRTVALPEGVDTNDVDAEYDQGVLTVRLKKTQQAQTRRVEVKTSPKG